jgi:sec-independent protein translocase protein TatA
MFGISGEHLLILGIVLLIFGPRRLPELGHTLGKAIRNFKDSISGIEEAKYRKLDDSPNKKPEALTQTSAPPQASHEAPTASGLTQTSLAAGLSQDSVSSETSTTSSVAKS